MASQSAVADAGRRLGALLCLGSAYAAAASAFDVKWVGATALGAVIVASGPAQWIGAPGVPRRLSWPQGQTMSRNFLPGWTLMLIAGAAKSLGWSPRLVIWVWCAGALWLLAGAWMASRPVLSPSRASPSVWMVGLLVLAVAVALRAWQIDAVPRQVHCDEGTINFVAQRFYADPARDWFAPPFRAGSYSIMNLFYAVAGMGTLVFGLNLVGARASDVVLGTASIILLFDGLRRVSTLRVAAVGALLLAANHCHIHYSRIASGYIQTAFVTALVFAIASRLWTAPTYFNAALLGLAAALGVQTYPASVVCVPLLVAALSILLLLQPARRHALMAPLVIVAVSCASAGAPFGVAIVQQGDELFARSREVNILGREKMSQLKREVYHTDSAVEVVAAQAWNALTGFHRGHDAQPQYGIPWPMADQYTAALMIPGVILALLRFPEFVAMNALVFTIGHLLLALGLQYAPGFNRATGALPLGMALAAIGLVQCCGTLWAGRSWPVRWARDLSLASVVVLCAAANLQLYFVDYLGARVAGDADAEAGWVAQRYGRDYRVHLVDWFPPGPEGLRLIAAEVPYEFDGLRDPVAYVKQANVSGRDLFVVYGGDSAARDALIARFPDARLEIWPTRPLNASPLMLVFVASPG